MWKSITIVQNSWIYGVLGSVEKNRGIVIYAGVVNLSCDDNHTSIVINRLAQRISVQLLLVAENFIR